MAGRRVLRHELSARDSGSCRGGAADAARAIKLYTKACDDNEPSACFNLGQATELGTSGLAKDPVKAALLYDKACNLDLAPACDDYKRLTGR